MISSIKNHLLKLTIFCVCLFIVSCNFNATYEDRIEDKNDAQKITNTFYDLLKAQKYKETYGLFSKRFFQITDTSKLNTLYDVISQRLGAIDEVNLDHWKTEIIKGSNPSSNYALFFLVKRDKYESRETVSLTKENGSIKIVGYNVISPGLLPANSSNQPEINNKIN